ncbi:MAG TPA: MYXO-CTERM sorting domain-containing protein [Thiobacillus sp.]
MKMNVTKLTLSLAASLAGLTIGPSAIAAVVYQNDFQSGAGSEWSQTLTENTPTPYPFGPRTFLGEFGNDTVSLSLAGLGAHSGMQLDFDLYLIRSWDGSSAGTTYDYGNDAFKVSVGGGPVLLDKTFSNGNPAGQSFGPLSNNPAFTGAAETYSLGYVFADGIQHTSQVMDSVYRLSFAFAHDTDQLTLNFSGYGLQGMDDESWGLDNVRVSAVPEPGVAPMLAVGVLALVWRMRRRVVAG